MLSPPDAAYGQAHADALTIPLQTPVINDFSIPPPLPDQPVKPALKEKAFSLDEAVNAKEILHLIGTLNQDQRRFLEKNRFLVLPGLRDWPADMPQDGYDEMLSRFDWLGGRFQVQDRTPQNARFVGPDIFLHAFMRYLNIRRAALESGRLRQMTLDMLEDLFANASALRRETSGRSRDNWERLAAQLIVPLILIKSGADQPPSSNGESPPTDAFKNARALFQTYRADFSDLTARNIITELERVYAADSRAANLLGLTSAAGHDLIDYSIFKPRESLAHKASARAYFRATVWLRELGWDMNATDGLADALNCALAMSYDSVASVHPVYASADSAATGPKLKKADEPAVVLSETWRLWGAIMELETFFSGHQSAPGLQHWLPFLMKEAGVDRFTVDTAADGAVLRRLADKSAAMAANMTYPHNIRIARPGKAVLSLLPTRIPLPQLLAAELTRGQARPEAPPAFSALYLPALLGQKYAVELAPQQVALDFSGDRLNPETTKELIQAAAASRAAALGGLTTALDGKLKAIPSAYMFRSLDAAWLMPLGALARNYGDGHPLYMQGAAYQARQLETALGGYTELRADLAFEKFADKASAGNQRDEGSADGPAAPAVKGFIEPNVLFWQEMTRLVRYTAGGFAKHGLFPEDLAEYGTLNRFLKRLERCAILSEKELAGQPLTDDDYEFIRLFTLDFMAAPAPGDDWHLGRKTALAAEIWTVEADSPEGMSTTVFEANAAPQLMLVLIGNDKTPRLTIGLAFDHYEIVAPHALRLTSERWRKLIYADQAASSSRQAPTLPPKNFWYNPLRP